jgi:putative NIF3 family GTP cyclohydrolase 1 type 2
MRAIEIRDRLRSLDGGWVDEADTVDTFKAGDPETAVDGVAVGWMSSASALERAVDLGCNVFVTHEPTYFDHRDDPDPEERTRFALEAAAEKRRWIEDRDLVILRCHDLWDRYPDEGIPDAWGRRLGFADPGDAPDAEEGFFRAYELDKRPARAVAERVARNVSSLGQEAVQLVGPADAPVSRVAVGTGAITPYERLVEAFDADLVVCSDDGFTYWRDGALAADAGVPAVVVNHATSELDGMRSLADRLTADLNVPVHHIEQTCTYDLVEG